MQSHIEFTAAAAVALLLLPAVPSPAQGPPPDDERRAEMVRRFDRNGDGKLSRDEIEAIRQSRENERGRGGERGSHRKGSEDRQPKSVLKNDERIQRLLERFDSNKDGRLDYGEMSELRNELKAGGHGRHRQELP